MWDVAADEYRLQPTRLIAPHLVLAEYAIRPHVGNQHRRSFPDEGQAAVGAVETEYADQPDMSLVGRQDLQIIDQVTSGRAAAAKRRTRIFSCPWNRLSPTAK